MTRNKYGLPTGLKSEPEKKKDPKMNLDTFKKIRSQLTMGEDLVESPNKNPYFQNVATGGKDVSGGLAKREKDSTAIKKSEGGKLAKKNRPTITSEPQTDSIIFSLLKTLPGLPAKRNNNSNSFLGKFIVFPSTSTVYFSLSITIF